jgi:hypothetical protein
MHPSVPPSCPRAGAKSTFGLTIVGIGHMLLRSRLLPATLRRSSLPLCTTRRRLCTGALQPELARHVETLLERYEQVQQEAASDAFNVERMRELSRLAEVSELHSVLLAKAKEATELSELASDADAEAELRALASSELTECEDAVTRHREELMTLLVPPDPADERGVELQVHAASRSPPLTFHVAGLVGLCDVRTHLLPGGRRCWRCRGSPLCSRALRHVHKACAAPRVALRSPPDARGGKWRPGFWRVDIWRGCSRSPLSGEWHTSCAACAHDRGARPRAHFHGGRSGAAGGR